MRLLEVNGMNREEVAHEGHVEDGIGPVHVLLEEVPTEHTPHAGLSLLVVRAKRTEWSLERFKPRMGSGRSVLSWA
jgi:hypothetical protein